MQRKADNHNPPPIRGSSCHKDFLFFLTTPRIRPATHVAGLFSVSKKSVTFLHASKTPQFLRKKVFTKNLATLVKKPVPDVFDGYNLITSGAFFSLRLGHAAALTCPRHVIHYRVAASLPLVLPCYSIISTKRLGEHAALQFFLSLKSKKSAAFCCFI